MEMSIIVLAFTFVIGYITGRVVRFEISLKDMYTLDKSEPLPVPEPYRTAIAKRNATTKARIVSPRKRISNDLSELDETNI